MAKKEQRNKRLVLLDAHAIIHRAYHALPEFTSPQGEPTGALYGLVSMLLKIITDLAPDYLAACFDRPEKTFREEVYTAYKATRAKTPEALEVQLERARDVFAALSISVYDAPGFEADDCLGTIVDQVKSEKDVEIIIATGDLDTLQLAEVPQVKIFTLRKGITDSVTYDDKGVMERFGFQARLLPDYKGLVGDPSDNIIGIKGIGEKTATTLIQKFGSLEEIYAKLKKNRQEFIEAGVKERTLKLLEEGKDEALFSKMLATLRRDAPVTFQLEAADWRKNLDPQKVDQMLAGFGFKTLRTRARLIQPQNSAALPASGLRHGRNSATGFAEGGAGPTRTEISAADSVSFKEAQVAFWLLDSSRTSPTLEDILSKTEKQNLSEAKKVLFDWLKRENLWKIFEEIEQPLIPILEEASRRGFLIDRPYFEKMSKEFSSQLAELEKKIWKFSGTKFNINSPKQLGEVLFDKLGIKPARIKKTAGGSRSTRASELEKLKGLHPVADLLLDYRELEKLRSTYIDAIPPLLDKENVLHTTFVQTGTTTGRFSSRDPNLQNIPIRTELGRRVRTGFIARPGHKLASFDYSQIELRVLAILSADPKLIKTFQEAGDIHTAVAMEVFGVPAEKIDREMRRRAKVINFGIIYGMGLNALRSNLGTSREEAQAFYEKYFATFPAVVEYLYRLRQEAADRGYTETLFGRRRYFPGLSSQLPYVQAEAGRMAQNAPIQGSAADIIKKAMVKIEEKLKEAGLEKKIHLLLQIHDELIYEVAEDKIEEASQLIKKIMEEVYPEQGRRVPLAVSSEVGDNWGEIS